MTTDERAVLDALTGRRTPITQADLAFGLVLPIRAVQEAIESLRLAGHPIVSSGDGMRLETDPEAVAACAVALHKRADGGMTGSVVSRGGVRWECYPDLESPGHRCRAAMRNHSGIGQTLEAATMDLVRQIEAELQMAKAALVTVRKDAHP